MPQHKSCEKRVRTSTKARARNRRDRSRFRTAQKHVLEAQDKKIAVERLNSAYDLLDRMTAKRVLHKNTVARRKARLARAVNALSD